MNEFKESLQETTTKGIDEKISSNIINVLQQLKEKTQVKEYQKQIEQRSVGVQQILVDFDHNMEIINRANQCRVLPSISVTFDRVKCVDHIIEQSISQRLENMYEDTVKTKTLAEEGAKEKQLRQILDRKVQIKQLLEQYDNNMELLERYHKRSNLETQEKSFSKSI